MDDNVYYVAVASACVFVAWKIIEMKYVRKSELNAKTTAVNAISVFVSVVAGAWGVALAREKTANVVGVFTSEPGF